MDTSHDAFKRTLSGTSISSTSGVEGGCRKLRTVCDRVTCPTSVDGVTDYRSISAHCIEGFERQRRLGIECRCDGFMGTPCCMGQHVGRGEVGRRILRSDCLNESWDRQQEKRWWMVVLAVDDHQRAIQLPERSREFRALRASATTLPHMTIIGTRPPAKKQYSTSYSRG